MMLSPISRDQVSSHAMLLGRRSMTAMVVFWIILILCICLDAIEDSHDDLDWW